MIGNLQPGRQEESIKTGSFQLLYPLPHVWPLGLLLATGAELQAISRCPFHDRKSTYYTSNL